MPESAHIQTGPDVRTCEGGGTLHMRGRIAVLHLRGTARERGRQHGLLLRERIQGGLIAYFMSVFRARIRMAAEQSGKLVARVVPFAVKQFYLNNFIFPRLVASMPREAREELAGLAEGAGIDPTEAAQTSVFPDVVLYFLAKNFQAMGKLLPDSAFEACTSFAAWGPATADGSFLYARNLDFFGVGVWDRHPAVLHHHPDRGMPFVSVAAAGVGLPGITAMNAAGVTVAPQIKRSRAVALGGVGMLYLADEIVRRAESLDDALKIAAEARPAVGFSLIVTDARNRAAAAIECSHAGVQARVRRGGAGEWNDPDLPVGAFVQTNHYTTPEQQAHELDIAATMRAHSVGRAQRGGELLRTHYGRITPARMAEFLADHHDPYAGRERMIGSVITQPCNISAAVFRPEAGEFWVAEGEAPVSHARFLRFTAADEPRAPGEADALPAPPAASDPRFPAYREFVRAYAAHLEGASNEDLAARLDRCAAGDAGEPIYPYLAGLFLLKAGRWAEAEQRFAQAQGRGKDLPHREVSLRCWRAAARSFAGGWEAARADFAAVAADERVGKDLRAWARTWAGRPPAAADLRGMAPDLQYGDAILSP